MASVFGSKTVRKNARRSCPGEREPLYCCDILFEVDSRYAPKNKVCRFLFATTTNKSGGRSIFGVTTGSRNGSLEECQISTGIDAAHSSRVVSANRYAYTTLSNTARFCAVCTCWPFANSAGDLLARKRACSKRTNSLSGLEGHGRRGGTVGM